MDTFNEINRCVNPMATDPQDEYRSPAHKNAVAVAGNAFDKMLDRVQEMAIEIDQMQNELEVYRDSNLIMQSELDLYYELTGDMFSLDLFKVTWNKNLNDKMEG